MQKSIDKGKGTNLCRVGSKKKRSKQDLDAVRDVETELKQDKQAFLLEMKRMKEIVSKQDEEIKQMSPEV